MRLANSAIHYAELFLAAVLVLANARSTPLVFFLSEQIQFLSLALYLLFFVYVLCYILKRPRTTNTASETEYSAFLHLVFAAIFIVYLLSLTSDKQLYFNIMAPAASMLITLGSGLVTFLPLFFLTFVGAYTIKKKRCNYGPALLLFLIVFLLLMLYYSSKFLFTRFTVDDEEILTLESVKAMLNGTNPYTVSVAELLYKHAGEVSSTITTNNNVMSVMDYPALFFLSFVPFYFVSQPTIQNLGSVDMPLQASVFIFILLLVFALALKKKDLLRPNLALLTFFVIAITNISSTTTYLMLALIVLAYAKIDSKYAWLPLGLCLSIQEALWLPVLFLFAYSLNRHGIRRGLLNIAGAAAVFLMINSYFIAANPGSYFEAVLGPLNKFILPVSPSPISFLLLKNYPMLLSSYTQVFGLLTVFLLLMFFYTNKKELIPVFSLIPLLIIPHIVITYYAFFLFLLLFAVCMKDRKIGSGVVERFLKKRKSAFCLVSLVIVVSILLTVYLSHVAYVKNFSIGVADQNLTVDLLKNTTTYTSRITYHNLSNGTVYMFAIARSGKSIGLVGFINNSLIDSKPECNTYTCYINTNRIELPENETQYDLRAVFSWPNKTKETDYVSIALYNKEYFYVGKSVLNAST